MIYKYIFAHSIVLPLRALTPLCFLALPPLVADLQLQITPYSRSWGEIILLCYSGVEVLFYFWFCRALKAVQVRLHPPVTNSERRLELWKSIKQSAMGDENPYGFLSSWFSVSTLSEVSRYELKQWLAWAVFDRQLEDIVSYSAKMELENMIVDGETEFNVCIPYESTHSAPPAMRLNIDPVKAQHRPLVYYAVTGLVSCAADAVLAALGFHRERIGPVCFWLRFSNKSKADEPLEEPLVFVHGVGIGLAAYLPLLFPLSKSNRTIMLIELPHVSMRLDVDVVPRMDVIAECAAIAMNRYSIPSALWMAHSLGTFVFAAVNRLQPQLVAGVVLVDPVCFLLWEPDLLRNFCYCKPETPMQIIQNYHISRELSISTYFHRHFWWHECVLFADSMPARSHVIISEHDEIYNTKRVLKYLETNHVPVQVLPGMQHGGWIMDSTATAQIVTSSHERQGTNQSASI